MILKEQIVAALKKVYDPEMPVNIVELGLIYGMEIDDAGQVDIRMTLTAPNCPVAGKFNRTFSGTSNLRAELAISQFSQLPRAGAGIWRGADFFRVSVKRIQFQPNVLV